MPKIELPEGSLHDSLSRWAIDTKTLDLYCSIELSGFHIDHHHKSLSSTLSYGYFSKLSKRILDNDYIPKNEELREVYTSNIEDMDSNDRNNLERHINKLLKR